MNTAWAPIIQSLMPQAVPVEHLLTSLAATMTPTVDSLINRLLPLTSSQPLAALAKAGVLEAVVVSSTALNTSSSNSSANQQAPAFSITVKVNQQLLELTSPLPLAQGARIQLSVGPNNTVQIISVAQAGGNSQQLAKPLAEALLRQPVVANPARSQAGSGNKPISNSGNPAVSPTTTSPATINRLAVEQSLRQSLPLQQPPDKLLPLLQQLASEAPAQWPKALTNNLAVLLQQFPRADQLQHTAGLQQALSNSGLFFEAKLNQQLAAAASNTGSQPAAGGNTSAPINYDIKGLLQRLVGQINKVSNSSAAASSATTNSPAALPPLLTAASRPEQPSIASYIPQPLPELLNNLQLPLTNTASKPQNNTDVVLRQLGQQLIASLARSQMNQLETLISRQAGTADQPAAVNSWTLETPILQGNHIDNLSVRIEQQQQQDTTDTENKQSGKLWVVMLAFDLHQLGKMNVQLKIVGQTVSATVWTEQQHTHHEALQQIQTLKDNLQKLGVTVKQIDCQLGLPMNSSQPLYTQLVDVHT
jgi:hypothetical protein